VHFKVKRWSKKITSRKIRIIIVDPKYLCGPLHPT